MLRRLLQIAIIFAVACTADAPSRSDLPRAASALSPAQAVAARGPGYLVWDSARTVWVDSAGGVVAERAGVVIAAGNALWAWTEGKAEAAGIDCGCANTPGDDHDDQAIARRCTVKRPVNTAGFVDLVSGSRSELMPPPDSSAEEAVPSQRARTVANVGPYVFTEVRARGNACGAHGFTNVEWTVHDLAHGGRLAALLTRRDSAAVLAREGEQARATLQRDSLTIHPVERVGLLAIEPAWNADGTLGVGYRFEASACYVCTDAFSSSYGASSAVPARAIPAPLAEWARAPEPVRRYWAAHPTFARAGWSVADPSLLAKFR